MSDNWPTIIGQHTSTSIYPFGAGDITTAAYAKGRSLCEAYPIESLKVGVL
ncbi:MAG: hypothetical protein HY694_03820 [Deltaproteobacteria bacterium]|nr:hypothetical protein [Deltaproteobacteria bacterium]